MNTPAHMALALAALGRRGRRTDWAAILAGALLPDAALFLREVSPAGPLAPLYPSLVPALESLPLWGLAAAAAWLAGRRALLLLALAAILHVLTDLPLHATDARAHFWPLSEARFVSPVSFWDHRHWGRVAGTLEGALFVLCVGLAWRRARAAWQKAVLTLLALIYAAAFLHFLGHAFAGAHWALW